MKTLLSIGAVAAVTVALAFLFGLAPTASRAQANKSKASTATVVKTEAEWKKILSPEAFDVLRKKGTERAFTGKYADYHGKGEYHCAACDLPLFSSATKFESGTGWPSFYQPLNKNAVREDTDTMLGMRRTEVLCRRCDGHLGHVFDDGPRPTGLRYCMNSVSLKFVPEKMVKASSGSVTRPK